MPADTLPALLADAPGVLLDRDRPLAYAELGEESARLAGALRELGVRRGDRVALWLPNIPAWLALLFACARLGAIAVSVNTRFNSHEVADIVGRSRARILCFWPGFKQIDFSGILTGCDPVALSALEALLVYEEDGAAPAEVVGKPAQRYRTLIERAPLADDASRPEAGCVMFTTSGTTRAPKFVLHDQRTLIRHARDVAAAFGYGAAQARILVTAPRAVFDEPALIAHCAARIAKFKVPLRVCALEAFPVTPGANATKIQKAKLREMAQAFLSGG